jgi:HK97 family phage major capsid protein/HK97 family phage prohead protease
MCPILEHAYSLLTVKSLTPEGRRFSGIASTPELDRQGESLDPAGVTFRESLPLLWHHDPRQPIGRVTLTATPEGILFDATIPDVLEPGTFKTRCDEAWHSIKAGVLTGVSLGLRILERQARRITKSEVCELSLVTIPANASASILLVKSLATERPNMTAAEQIQTLETTRTELATKMETLLHANAEDQAVADVKLEIKSADARLDHWRDLEAIQRKTATIVPASPSPFRSVSVSPVVPPGTAFVRYVCAQLACKQYSVPAYEYAQRWNGSTPEVALALKAAVAAGTATDATWAGPLVQPNISNDMVELLRAATIVDKIPGLYTVPFNVKLPQQTGGGTYSWVGETKPKPVSALAFASLTLDWAKIAGIIVLTQELIKLSNPKAEDVVRREMVNGIARFIDTQFTDPAVAAVAGVNPASITNGAPTAAATANPLADILGLISHFTTNNIPVDGLTFIMSPANAMALSFKTYSDGSPQFPGIALNGGSWKGMTFIVSNTVTTKVIAMQPALILYADDGGVTIDASTEASLQMDSAPMSPVDATTVYVSMFQANCVALRAERFINWKRVNTNAVKYLTAAAWPAPTSDGQAFQAAEDEPPPTTRRGKNAD